MKEEKKKIQNNFIVAAGTVGFVHSLHSGNYVC